MIDRRPRPRALSVRVAFLTLVAVLAWLAIACGGPKYPNCDNDSNCNTEGHKGVCITGKCVECRSDDSCDTGKECKGNACVAISGYCDDKKACDGGATCGKDHRCHQETSSNEPTECDDDHPCKAGKCQNGHCVLPPNGGPGCTDFPPPRYDYESADLAESGKETLGRLAKCIASGSLKARLVVLTGHCDARGEYEFNMGLGANRAEGVKTFLLGLGVPAEKISTSSRGKLDATGSDETGWAIDRRVDIEVR